MKFLTYEALKNSQSRHLFGRDDLSALGEESMLLPAVVWITQPNYLKTGLSKMCNMQVRYCKLLVSMILGACCGVGGTDAAQNLAFVGCY